MLRSFNQALASGIPRTDESLMGPVSERNLTTRGAARNPGKPAKQTWTLSFWIPTLAGAVLMPGAIFFAIRTADTDARRQFYESTAKTGAVVAELERRKPSDNATLPNRDGYRTPGSGYFEAWSLAIMAGTDATDSGVATSGVSGVMLLDDEGDTVLAFPSDLARVETEFREDEPTAATGETRFGIVALANGRITSRFAACDIVGGGKVVILIPDVAWAAPVWSHFRASIVLALVPIFFLGASLSWIIRRRFLAPLNAMSQAVRAGAQSVPLPAALQERRDIVGAISRPIDAILEELRSTRSRHKHLERTIDERVASRTRRVETMLKRAKKEAWIDPLTRLGNRRVLEERLEALVKEQRQIGETLSVVVFDVDNFKALNDELGHAAGDELLTFIGDLLKGSLRASDLGLRLGGDEFAAILLGTAASEAVEMADRLIKLFGQRARLLKVSRPVSVSAGVASLGQKWPESGEALMKAADDALYSSKSRGKSLVTVHRLSLQTALR
jgi:diguanylate cyclase (GGDEF)-like protein